MVKVRIHGGPAHGGIQTLKPGAYIWIDREGEKHADWFPGSALYRVTPDGYFYCGDRITRCRCGAYIERAALQCGLCGARV